MNELTNCEVDIVGGDGEFVVSREIGGGPASLPLVFARSGTAGARSLAKRSSVLLRCGAS